MEEADEEDLCEKDDEEEKVGGEEDEDQDDEDEEEVHRSESLTLNSCCLSGTLEPILGWTRGSRQRRIAKDLK